MEVNIKEARKDLKKRQESVVGRINANIAQQRQLQAEMQELAKEAEHLNGEARMLNKLSGNGKKQKQPK